MIDFINDKRFEFLCGLAEHPGCALFCVPLQVIGHATYSLQYEYKEPSLLRLIRDLGPAYVYSEINQYAYNWLDLF